MKLIDFLKQFRNDLLSIENEDDFKSDLQNHSISNKNIYRLYFVEYLKSDVTNGIHETNWPSEPFMLPEGMTREEGFKVISYLTDQVDEKCGEFTLKSANTLNSVIFLERFGFTKVSEKNEKSIIDLFTIAGRIRYFKGHPLYKKYFEWYQKNVSKREVIDIYDRLGMEFKDIVWLDDENKGINKTLKK